MKTFGEAFARNWEGGNFAALEPSDMEFLRKKTEAILKLVKGFPRPKTEDTISCPRLAAGASEPHAPLLTNLPPTGSGRLPNMPVNLTSIHRNFIFTDIIFQAGCWRND